jgi:hypothetical protein
VGGGLVARACLLALAALAGSLVWLRGGATPGGAAELLEAPGHGAASTLDARGLPLELEGLFEPGSLTMPLNESLAMCQPESLPAPELGPDAPWRLCSYSEKGRVVVYMTPKSGSSSGRHMMEAYFADTVEIEYAAALALMLRGGDLYRVGTAREPLERFFSQYDEVFARLLGRPHLVPEQYRAYAKPYENWTHQQYVALQHSPGGTETLTRTFKQFLHDYDGRFEFNPHFRMQVHHMWNALAGEPLRFERIVRVGALEDTIAELAHVDIQARPPPIWDRKFSRRFNVTMLTDDEVRKICRIAMSDYCCLNFELPATCKHAPRGERVRCKYASRRGRPAIVPLLA